MCSSTHLYGRRLVLEWAEDEDSVDALRKRTAEHFHGSILFNENIKNNVMIIIVIIILITMIIIITIIIMIITHKDSELIYSICILYVRYPTQRRRNGKWPV